MWLASTVLVPCGLPRAHVADCVNKGIVKPANQLANQVTWKGAHWLEGADVTMAGMNVASSVLVSVAVIACYHYQLKGSQDARGTLHPSPRRWLAEPGYVVTGTSVIFGWKRVDT